MAVRRGKKLKKDFFPDITGSSGQITVIGDKHIDGKGHERASLGKLFCSSLFLYFIGNSFKNILPNLLF